MKKHECYVKWESQILEVNCPNCKSINKTEISYGMCPCRKEYGTISMSMSCFYCQERFHWHKGHGVFHDHLSLTNCYDSKGKLNH